MTASDPLLIGIDLGTSSLKMMLVDTHGRAMATAARDYPLRTPQPGWAEQDPADWLAAALQTLREVMQSSGADPARVAAIGLSGQMHGLVCLGRDLQPLRPAIIWADARSAEQVARIQADISPAELAALTGNPVATGFMLPSLLWLRDHEGDLFERVHLALLPKDALRLCLTGAAGSEPSDAASTLLFDPARGAWSGELLARFGLPGRILPPIQPSTAIAGGLLPVIAAQTGLLPGTPVVMGASDQAAQAIGNGVIDPGRLSCTIGTGGQLLAPTRHPTPDPLLRVHLFNHAVPERWFLEAAILSAGLSLRWLRETLFPHLDYTQISDLAATAPPGCEGLFFLPYLAGERTPLMDPTARAGLIGLTLRHGPAHIARAVMEGVVLALRQGLDIMRALGADPAMVVASGGGTRHPLWLQLQADIFNRPIAVTATAEAAALGAALLAGLGAQLYPDLPAAIHAAVTPAALAARPDPGRVAIYAAAYAEFTGLYPRLHSASPRLG